LTPEPVKRLYERPHLIASEPGLFRRGELLQR